MRRRPFSRGSGPGRREKMSGSSASSSRACSAPRSCGPSPASRCATSSARTDARRSSTAASPSGLPLPGCRPPARSTGPRLAAGVLPGLRPSQRPRRLSLAEERRSGAAGKLARRAGAGRRGSPRTCPTSSWSAAAVTALGMTALQLQDDGHDIRLVADRAFSRRFERGGLSRARRHGRGRRGGGDLRTTGVSAVPRVICQLCP